MTIKLMDQGVIGESGSVLPSAEKVVQSQGLVGIRVMRLTAQRGCGLGDQMPCISSCCQRQTAKSESGECQKN